MPGNAIVQQLMGLSAAELRRELFASSLGRRSYGEARSGMLAHAGWLAGAEGIKPGDRVAICLPKSPETIQLIYGILATGAAYVPLPYQGAPERLSAVIASIRPALFVTTRQMAALIRAAGETLSAETRVIEVGEEAALAALCRGIPPSRALAGVSPADLAAVFFTSGSTDEPKGVMWSQRGMAESVSATVKRRGATADDRFISVAQLHYSASCEIFYPVITGARVWLCTDREQLFVDHLAEIVAREATTIWGATSTALRLLVEGGNLPARGLPAMRVVEFFGERIPIHILRAAMEAMHRADFRCVYGATEAFNIAEYVVPRPLRPDIDDLPLGRPCPGYDFSLRDEGRNEVGTGKIGEICIAGPGVTMGYWNEALPNAMRRLAGVPDSFCTGDLARFADDGFIRFVGRRDQMVKIRGHRFELGEIEAAARSEPRVSEAVAFTIGGAAETDGVVLALLSDADEGEHAGIEGAVRRIAQQRLPRFAHPQRIVVYRKFPLLSTGKIDRRLLAALVAAG